MMRSRVVIDCFPQAAERYGCGYAVVAIDVVRATTTAITIADSGCSCFPVPTLKAALELHRTMPDSLLAGEQQGFMPPGFNINNSPTEFLALRETDRPVILLSSTGTSLCHAARGADRVFLASLRNYGFVAKYLIGTFPNVAVIGAGSRGEFREEDQLCCAWVAESLLESGYDAADRNTLNIVRRWSNKPADAWINNKSASYLKSSGQIADLEFILGHVDDLEAQFAVHQGEVTAGRWDLESMARDGKRATA
jgi:2-phosphosulfolactate phosphatase